MKDNTYNGWTNYETWLVNLWIDNEPYSSESFSNQAADLCGSYDREGAIVRLEEAIADQVSESCHYNVPPASLQSDLIASALSCVNWQEIATHYVDDWIEFDKSESEAA